MPNLKYVHVGFGSHKKNTGFNALVSWAGKHTGDKVQFVFE